MDLSDLQSFINKHSKFTDTVIEELNIKNIDNKYDNVEFTIRSKFENYRVKVNLEEVSELKVDGIYQYSIWELNLIQEEDSYIFNPSPVSSEMGNLYFKAKKIQFEEVKLKNTKK